MSNIASALTSLLMSLPLVAVPCLAVFGLPSIGPATAEAETDETLELGVQEDLGPATADLGNPAGSAPEFAPIVDAGSDDTDDPFAVPTADRSQIDPTSDHRGAAANAPAGLREATRDASARAPDEPFQFVAVDDDNATPASRTDEPAATRTSTSTQADNSWESLVKRLENFGIRQFHLTNGEAPGAFYFTCSVRSARNVTQKFEAEGASPAAAAQDVLAQVEQWQSTR